MKPKITDVDDDQNNDLDDNQNDNQNDDQDDGEGTIYEFDSEGNVVEPPKPTKKTDEPTQEEFLANQLKMLQNQYGEVATKLEELTKSKNQQQQQQEPELKKPVKPVKPKRPADFNLNDTNDVSSSTYKYLIADDEYREALDEYHDDMEEYRDAVIERDKKLYENERQYTRKQREQVDLTAGALSRLQKEGLTVEEAMEAWNEAISGKLFTDGNIAVLYKIKKGSAVNQNKNNQFDKNKIKRDRAGAAPPINGNNGNTKEKMEKGDFTTSSDKSWMYHPQKTNQRN